MNGSLVRIRFQNDCLIVAAAAVMFMVMVGRARTIFANVNAQHFVRSSFAAMMHLYRHAQLQQREK